MSKLTLYRFGALFISTIAYYFATQAISIPLLLWVAPLPLMLLILNNRGIYTALTVFLSFFLGNFLGFFSIYSGTHFPILVVVVTFLIDSAIFTSIAWLFSLVVQRLQSWSSVFLFPIFWVTYLYLLTALIKNGNITSLSIFSQILFLPIVQIVSLTGPLGLNFLLLLFPAGLALSWHFRKNQPKQAYLSLFATLSILLIVFVFGVIRLYHQENSAQIKIGLGAKNPVDVKSFRSLQDRDPIGVARSFTKTVDRLAQAGAQYVLQPELSLMATPDNEKEIFGFLSQAALGNQVYIFAPIGLIQRPEQRNALAVFSPNGSQLFIYNKIHPVSGGEIKLTPGNELSTIPTHDGVIGVEICHDMDFYQPIRTYSKMGVEMLFVPAEDYGANADGTWHAQVAILQSISCGMSLARAAFFGFLSLTDAYGKILAWEQTQIDGDTYLVADLPFGPGRTFYATFGNWFPLLNCIGAFLLFCRLLIFRKKSL